MKSLAFGALLLFATSRGVAESGESRGGSFGVIARAGGGGTSHGDRFAMTASVGDATAGTLSGGAFQLKGGFIGVLIETTVGGDAKIAITLDAGEAVLSWDSAGYVLEFRNALNGSSPWETVNLAPTDRRFSTSASLPARFFRLRRGEAATGKLPSLRPEGSRGHP